MASRGKIWSEDGTKTLISLWGEESIQLALDNSKTTKKSSAIYSSVWVQLQKSGFTDFTLKEVINKIKKLRIKYRTEKDKSRKSGNGAAKKWKYFDSVDRFLAQRHSVTPPVVYDTLAETESETVASMNNENKTSVDELVEKYGMGEINTQKCNTCSYEQDIHSGGVHVSENGAVKVYEEEDCFHCPNCDPFGILDENRKELERPEKESGSVQMPSKQQSQKKKRKTNVEKSLEIVFQKFQDSANNDFLRYQRLEDERQKREHQFHLQQITLENERRREERDHEFNMMQMLTSHSTSAMQTPQTLNSSTITTD